MTKDGPAVRASREGALILCSGRCGSTILADLLAEHAGVLPLMEFFYPQFQGGIPEGTPTGEEFWSLLNRPWRSLNTVVALGRVPAEMRYKIDDLGEIPEMSGLLGYTLPTISDEPDKLLGKLNNMVPYFPEQPLSAHFHQLFELLCELSDKDRWIEKSAASCLYAPDLLPMFPGAKIIYLMRDCVDVAMSMTHHPMFQLGDLSMEFVLHSGIDPYSLRSGIDPYSTGSSMPERELAPELERLLPEKLTADLLDERAGSHGSLIRLVILQALMVRRVEEALAARSDERVLRVRYEDLLDKPQEELSRLGQFLGLADWERWASRSATRIRKPVRLHPELDSAQRSLLNSVYRRVVNAPENPLAAFVK